MIPIVYDRWSGPVLPGLSCADDPSMTHQEFKGECDINAIMARALKTGMIPTRTDMGTYGDFSDAPDFHAAQDVLIKARDQFAALPSKVRTRFDNDPAKFLSFVHAPTTTLEELNDLGLLREEASARLAADKASASASGASVPGSVPSGSASK